MFTLTFMLIVSLLCLAIPVVIYLRMLITGPADRARIHTRMAAHRRGPEQDTAPSRQTEAVPCHPVAQGASEVSSS
ncbi:hypothetical protein AB0F17_37630 [Nonomuraea sp. NPDC026600]|uniref:hypothetical protein n=1 Tax=Nonomuraea sp. NPDC026600 TaxID=3155363 RepID=UPI0033FA6383